MVTPSLPPPVIVRAVAMPFGAEARMPLRARPGRSERPAALAFEPIGRPVATGHLLARLSAAHQAILGVGDLASPIYPEALGDVRRPRPPAAFARLLARPRAGQLLLRLRRRRRQRRLSRSVAPRRF